MALQRMIYSKKRDTSNPIVPGHEFLYEWIKPYAKKKKLLDIGCWTGALESLFSKMECHVTGTDIEEEPLKYARRKYRKYRFLKSSIIETQPFKKNEFDIVMYFMVIEHIPAGTELTSLANINRIIKKGGLLFMNTMNSNILSNILDPAYFFGHRHYSKEHLAVLLNLAGFKIVEVKYNAGFFTTLHMLLLYFCKHILHTKEPRNRFLDYLMRLDYRDRGFAEIDLKCIKVKDL